MTLIIAIEATLLSVYAKLHLKDRKLAGTGRAYDIENNRIQQAVIKFFIVAVPLLTVIALYFNPFA